MVVSSSIDRDSLMPIFEVQKDELRNLSDSQLEELVAKLAEAELASNHYSPACVFWSDSIDVPDGGIDVSVDVPVEKLETDFLTRPKTIFQAKKKSMPVNEIRKEMCPSGHLRSVLSKQAEIRGSYIIVSLSDDCTNINMRDDRLKAMRAAMDGDPNKDNIHLDFFDRPKLVQWLRQHPAVVLWVQEILGRRLIGWRAYGRWSNPPFDADDTLIRAPGVSITLPTGKGDKLMIEEAIKQMRELVRSTKKPIRVIGLSGVGKTRIVQSLFDERIGDDALDRTVAIYADAGAAYSPSAVEMLDRLSRENRRAIMVLDNCSSALHATLASEVASTDSQITLITVEYDIRNDEPQSTEVVRIEADGAALAEELLLQRYPKIGSDNAKRISEFAYGNAKVSLVVAERVNNRGESLARLSDASLFDRLFEQKHQPDHDLRSHAQLLALVYSFSVSSPKSMNHQEVFETNSAQHSYIFFKILLSLKERIIDFVGLLRAAILQRESKATKLRRYRSVNTGQINDIDELAVLGSILEVPREQLYRSVAELLQRGIVQQRSDWRAILPHVIANKLAGEALNNVPKKTLRNTFEAPGHKRLLESFARRLGSMHDHPVAHEIAEAWLEVDGRLGKLLNLDEFNTRILEFVAPIKPCAVLERLEAEINNPESRTFALNDNYQMTIIINLIRSLAYDADKFSRCVELLLILAEIKDDIDSNKLVKKLISSLFQPYLSGTHASLDRRLEITRKTIMQSKSNKRRECGFHMLSSALKGSPWSSSYMNNFGARPRDTGIRPCHQQFVEWRCKFIELAVELDDSGDIGIAESARLVLAKRFRDLWEFPPNQITQKTLLNAVRDINNRRYWVDGYKAIQKTIFYADFNNENEDDKLTLEDLRTLKDELVPATLVNQIEAVFKSEHDYWLLDDSGPDSYEEVEQQLISRAEELGEEFARSRQSLSELESYLYSTNVRLFQNAFGKGLAKGAEDLKGNWRELVNLLHTLNLERFSVSLLCGFIEVIDGNDRGLAQRMLDQCLEDKLLRRALVELHPQRTFDCTDFDRCIRALADEEVSGSGYGVLFWRSTCEELPVQRLVKLAECLLKKPDGETIILEALSMKFRRIRLNGGKLDVELKRLGLKAATARLLRIQSDPDGAVDYYIKRIIGAVLPADKSNEEVTKWLDTIFSVIDSTHGYLHGYAHSIRVTAEKMPQEFLDRVFPSDKEIRKKRWFFINQDKKDQLPLDAIDIDVLIDWCRNRDDHEVWQVVASGIYPWMVNKSDELVDLSEAAMKLLESAPNKEHVLAAYSCKIKPTIYSLSDIDLMRQRALAIKKLTECSENEIASAASIVSKKSLEMIEKLIETHKKERLRGEQRFE